MKKYQDALMAAIHDQLENWLEQRIGTVPYDDIYRFLHSVRGTSGTIGLSALSDTTRSLMEQLERQNRGPIPTDELRQFLLPLAEAFIGDHEAAAGFVVSEQVREFMNPPDQPVVLVMDHDAVFLVYVKEALESRGYMVFTATTSAQAVSYMHEFRPDCVVLDFSIKNGSGFDHILLMREKLRDQFIPTTIVSTDDRSATRVQAYRLGADDFIRKPLDLAEFLAVLERQMERKRLFDRLLAHDELTGALKRRYTADTFLAMRQASIDNGEPYAIAHLDVDRLRRINQSFGPDAGDQVLKAVVEHMNASLQLPHTVVRYGGGSFLIFLQGVHEPDARKELAAALNAFADIEFETMMAGSFRASWSAGVTEPDEPDQPVQHWLGRAGKALSAAKDAGGGIVAAARDVTEQISLRQLRIAIVDDDAIMRSLLSNYAVSSFPNQDQLDIRHFSDGESFLADGWTHGEDRYLVILDRKMPGMDGLQVLQRIREFGRFDQFTVLMLFGKKGGESEADAVKAVQLGVDDYVTKPFSVRELEARIRRLTGWIG